MNHTSVAAAAAVVRPILIHKRRTVSCRRLSVYTITYRYYIESSAYVAILQIGPLLLEMNLKVCTVWNDSVFDADGRSGNTWRATHLENAPSTWMNQTRYRKLIPRSFAEPSMQRCLRSKASVGWSWCPGPYYRWRLCSVALGCTEKWDPARVNAGRWITERFEDVGLRIYAAMTIIRWSKFRGASVAECGHGRY